MASRTISFKPNFLVEIGRRSPAHQAQVFAKIGMLATDPEPDAKTRKRLRGVENGLCRMRSGDYRVFYTFTDESVSLFGVRLKGDDTYDDMPDVEELAHGDFVVEQPRGPTAEDFAGWIAPVDNETPLPESITAELLNALEIPAAYHARLVAMTTEEALLACPGVPDDHLLSVHQHMFVKPIALVAEEPTLIAVGGVDDLMRFTEGKLVTFLLQLDPEQRKFVAWATDAAGPTLVKGGPGTGKSTVAIYRVREMIRVLRAAGVASPKLLFTTYTNALVTFSKQLLETLLAEDASCVEVRTADSLVASILSSAGEGSRRPNSAQRSSIQKAALEAVTFGGSALQQAAQAGALQRLGHTYVFEEIETVIQGRGIGTLAEYLAAARPGRRVGLRETQRRAIWAVGESYANALEEAGFQTWQQARGRAAAIALTGAAFVPEYDAVIVDEAQDLDANAIRLLVHVCSSPNRIFLTADENQSIYAAGFGWSDIHEELQFRGRTGILQTNHRSTEQIIEAARGYLAAGLPDDLAPDRQSFAHTGPQPAWRQVTDLDAEADLVARFLRGASRELRLTIGSGAVVVPDSLSGTRLASALKQRGVPATYRDSKHFELDDNTVTVLPLLAAKGLEFPVVAVAGFVGSEFPRRPEDMTDEVLQEFVVRERRTLFVAMTRAMRALLVVTPEGHPSDLLSGFDPLLWNVSSQ